METTKLVLIDLEGNENTINNLPKTIENGETALFRLDAYNYSFNTTSKSKLTPLNNFTLKIKSADKLEEKLEVGSFESIVVYKEGKVVKIFNYIDLNDSIKRYNSVVGVNNNDNIANLIHPKNSKFYPIALKKNQLRNPKLLKKSSQIFINVWTFEERELLKKALLSFASSAPALITLSGVPVMSSLLFTKVS